jgi:hypothetical protein
VAYCIKCGAQLPDEANFCWQCGAAQPKLEPAPSGRYETCEIICETVKTKFGVYAGEVVRFTAAVAGQPSFARSPKFEVSAFDIYGPNQKNKKHLAAFEALVNKLTADGWTRAEDKGPYWYHVTFTRVVQD